MTNDEEKIQEAITLLREIGMQDIVLVGSSYTRKLVVTDFQDIEENEEVSFDRVARLRGHVEEASDRLGIMTLSSNKEESEDGDTIEQ